MKTHAEDIEETLIRSVLATGDRSVLPMLQVIHRLPKLYSGPCPGWVAEFHGALVPMPAFVCVAIGDHRLPTFQTVFSLS